MPELLSIWSWESGTEGKQGLNAGKTGIKSPRLLSFRFEYTSLYDGKGVLCVVVELGLLCAAPRAVLAARQTADMTLRVERRYRSMLRLRHSSVTKPLGSGEILSSTQI